MRAIIRCAGSGSRWNHYTGVRKHLLTIEGERLVDRLVRQLRARDITDIALVYPEAHASDYERVTDVTHCPVTDPRSLFPQVTARALILLGDTWWTDAAMDLLVARRDVWTSYARLTPSEVTGKPGPEQFAVQIPAGQFTPFFEARASLGEPSPETVLLPRPLWATPDPAHHVEIPDDGTDDFDFPDDYERWLSRAANRSSRRVRSYDFSRPWFQARRQELHLGPQMHRKVWEFCAIAQAVTDRVPPGFGRAALGFGVGREPMPAWFAAQGYSVVATDRPEQGVWLDRQWSGGLHDLPWKHIADETVFRERVSYVPWDMRHPVAAKFGGLFDVTWSTSSLEHLGGRAAAVEFFVQQMAALRPGGFALHTTEVVPPDRDIGLRIDGADLCTLGVEDLQRLDARLRAQGDRLWAVSLDPAPMPEDQYVDTQPFSNGAEVPHLTLRLGSVVFTSVLLIAVRGGA